MDCFKRRAVSTFSRGPPQISSAGSSRTRHLTSSMATTDVPVSMTWGPILQFQRLPPLPPLPSLLRILRILRLLQLLQLPRLPRIPCSKPTILNNNTPHKQFTRYSVFVSFSLATHQSVSSPTCVPVFSDSCYSLRHI